ncbi:MAG: DciA family protein [Coriobacteriales bacterium]|jgi:hypothetical protein|nr:DciA family protein [Coriobacteriales bacterium]
MARRQDKGKGQTSLSVELRSFVVYNKAEGFEETRKLRCAWEKICDSQTLNHTDNLVYSKNNKNTHGLVVLVYLDDSHWAAELSMSKELLRFKLSQELKQPVSDLVFGVNRRAALKCRFQKSQTEDHDAARRAGAALVEPIPLTEEEEGHAREILSNIPDEQVKNKLYKAMKLDWEWKKGSECSKLPEKGPQSPEYIENL